MVEKRRFKRIPVYIRITEIDRDPKGESNLLDISAFGAKIETPTKYRAGQSIKFSYIPPGPSYGDLEIDSKATGILNNPTGLVKKILIKGRVVWVSPHPNKADYFLVGLKYFPRRNTPNRIFAIITLLSIVAIIFMMVTQGPDLFYRSVNSLVDWFSSLYYTVQSNLSRLLPFLR